MGEWLEVQSFIHRRRFDKMPLFLEAKPSATAHKTTLLINKEDWEFIKRRGLKPTNLLRSKIHEIKDREEGKPDAEQLLKNLKKMQAKLSDFFEFLDQKQLLDEFLKKQKA